MHKVKCKRNQVSGTAMSKPAPGSVPECLRALKKFTDKHRMMIGEMAVHPLCFYEDVSNAERSCLMILVHSRDAARREHSFYATDVSVVPYTDMPPG